MKPPPHPPGARFGVWIAVALMEAREDGHEVEWSCMAWRPSAQGEWLIDRDVFLNESPIGESVVLGSTELPTLSLPGTGALAKALPRLVDELLETPAPTQT